MQRKFFKGALAFASAAVMVAAVGCSKDEASTPGVNFEWDGEVRFNISWCDSDTNTTGSYLQSFTTEEIEDDSNMITFVGKGYEVPCTRSAYVSAQEQGAYIYSYDYGGGTLDKLGVVGGSSYTNLGQKIDLSVFSGTTYSRFTTMDDDLGAGVYVNTTKMYDEATGLVYEYTKSELVVTMVDLKSMTSNASMTSKIILPNYSEEGGPADKYEYIGRADSPTILGDYIYFGFSSSKVSSIDPSTSDSNFIDGKAGVIRLDYPSLTNPAVFYTGLNNRQGGELIADTYGYRSPAMHEYSGSLYQVTMNNMHILKLGSNGYDDDYVFDIAAALGKSDTQYAKGTGWFYAGNGIGYVPYVMVDSEDGSAGTTGWGVARVDLAAKTAVDLTVPADMNLWYCQNMRVEGGYIYMALCPEGSNGAIYKFEISSTSPTGTECAELRYITSSYYAGIY